MHYLLKSWSENFNVIINIKKTPEDFPGGPVVKIPHFHCGGGGTDSVPGQGNSTCYMVQTEKKDTRNY